MLIIMIFHFVISAQEPTPSLFIRPARLEQIQNAHVIPGQKNCEMILAVSPEGTRQFWSPAETLNLVGEESYQEKGQNFKVYKSDRVCSRVGALATGRGFVCKQLLIRCREDAVQMPSNQECVMAQEFGHQFLVSQRAHGGAHKPDITKCSGSLSPPNVPLISPLLFDPVREASFER